MTGDETTYSLRNVLRQSPDKLKGGMLLIGTAVVVTKTGSDPAAVLASWSVAVERILEWFWVAPAKAANAANDLAKLNEAVEAGPAQSAASITS